MVTSCFSLREGSSGVANAEQLDRAWAGAATFAYLPEKSPVTDAWVDAALDALPPEMQVEHFALLTSGSRGHPKLIVGARARAEALCHTLHRAQRSEPVESAIVTLPLSYCYAFVNQWLWARVFERRLVTTDGFGVPDALRSELVNAADAMVCLVGAQLSLFERHFPGEVFPEVIRVHFAGGPFPQGDIENVRTRFPNAEIFNNYGCAEAMPRLTLRGADEASSSADIGRALDGIEISLGADGEMLFRSPFSAVAFFEDDRLQILEPHTPIATGDFAREGTDGRWELLGRSDQVFKRYGEKVALGPLLDTVAESWSGEAHFYRETDSMNEAGFVLLLSPEPRAEEVRTPTRSSSSRCLISNRGRSRITWSPASRSRSSTDLMRETASSPGTPRCESSSDPMRPRARSMHSNTRSTAAVSRSPTAGRRPGSHWSASTTHCSRPSSRCSPYTAKRAALRRVVWC